jgi:pilus assembly protein CpaF
VGEVRDREALPLLLTLSSGVKGLATIHAGSARQALTRLRFLCQLADTSSDLPLDALNTLVTEAVDLVVHCARVGGTVKVTEVVAVEDGQASARATQFTVTPLFRRPGGGGSLAWTGNLPVRMAPALAEVADLQMLLEAGSGDRRPRR